MRLAKLGLLLALMAARSSSVWAQVTTGIPPGANVRTYQENGVTYRETRYQVTQPVTETQLTPQTRTIYHPRVTTSYQPVTRTYRAPVTEYQTETYLKNRWNPFKQPYYDQRQVARTRWETRAETVHVPTTQHEYVPETTTVHVPVTTQRMAQHEVTSRVAISGSPTSSFVAAPQTYPARVAPPPQSYAGQSPYGGMQPGGWQQSSPPVALSAAGPTGATTSSQIAIGGLQSIEQDPPRVGTAWRPSGTLQR
jgi:hypothetical protein